MLDNYAKLCVAAVPLDFTAADRIKNFKPKQNKRFDQGKPWKNHSMDGTIKK